MSISTDLYSQMIFNKGTKTIQLVKDCLSTIALGKLDTHKQKKWNWTHTLHYPEKLTQVTWANDHIFPRFK